MSAPRQGEIPNTIYAAPGDMIVVLRPDPTFIERPPEQRWKGATKALGRIHGFINVFNRFVVGEPRRSAEVVPRYSPDGQRLAPKTGGSDV